jgi:hypothetical protein
MLGGSREGALKQWLAVCTLLEEPLAALFLTGVKGAGKSLLAEGLSRLWGPRPTQIQEAVGGNFNDQAAKNPVIFADETGPLQATAGFRTHHLRWLVQARVRPLRRMYQAPATLIGAPRVIFATNDEGAGASTDENLTSHDIAAIAERIIYVPVGEETTAYLESLKQQDPDIFHRWVEGGAIARHVLWLRDNLKVERQGRFLVIGDSEELLTALTTSAGVRSEVCQWCIGFLQNPKPVEANSAMRNLVMIDDGAFLVNAKAIYEGWAQYLPNDRNPPRTAQISKALAGLSKPERRYRRIGGRMIAFRELDLKFLVAWGESTGYATEEDIIHRIVAMSNEAQSFAQHTG